MSEKRELKNLIGEAMGFASMCWDPRPTGVFKSDCAAAHLDNVMTEIDVVDRDSYERMKALVEEAIPIIEMLTSVGDKDACALWDKVQKELKS